jgi:muramidase (phage lysozyme)
MITSTIMSVVFAPIAAVPAEQNTVLLAQVDAKELARELLTKRQYKCFSRLIGKESAWKNTARNPQSTAKGIGQLLDSTYRNLGMKHSEQPAAQVVVALSYIGRKYGAAGPCGAWKHWQKNNWY